MFIHSVNSRRVLNVKFSTSSNNIFRVNPPSLADASRLKALSSASTRFYELLNSINNLNKNCKNEESIKKLNLRHFNFDVHRPFGLFDFGNRLSAQSHFFVGIGSK